MNILIRGVRHNIHSVSMVNQFLLLAFDGMQGLTVRHEDLSSRWAPGDCGFDEQDQRVIERFVAPQPDEAFDAVLSYAHHEQMPASLDPSRRFLFVVTEFGRFTPEVKAVLRDQVEQGAHLITPSRWSAHRLINALGDQLAPSIGVIAHGVDSKYYHPITPDQQRANRATLGIGEHEFVYMNLGAGTWNKGIDLVLKGFDQVLQSGREARLILKDLRMLYKSRVDDLIATMISQGEISERCIERIVFCPAQLNLPQMGALYNLADCYLSPYRAEGFNLPVLEALACGVPVIATKDGATADFADASVAMGIESQFYALPPEQGQGHYLEPSLDHLINLMQACHDMDIKRSGHFAQGLSGVADRMGWNVMAQRHVEHFSQALCPA